MITTFVVRLDDNKGKSWALFAARSNVGYQYKVFVTGIKNPVAEGWMAKFEQNKSIDFLKIFMELFDVVPIIVEHDIDITQALNEMENKPKELLKLDEISKSFVKGYNCTEIIGEKESHKVKYIEDEDDENYEEVEKGSYEEILNLSFGIFCDWCRKPGAIFKRYAHGGSFFVCSEDCYKEMDMLFDTSNRKETKFEKIKKSTDKSWGEAFKSKGEGNGRKF
jgi:hypothetical protein